MPLHPLNALELDQLLTKVGFPNPDVATTTSPSGLFRRRSAWAKAMAESNGIYDIVGGPNPNGSYDYGLFQINDVHKADIGTPWGPTPSVSGIGILDPVFNATLAFQWSKGGADWSTWGLGMLGWAGQLHSSNLAAWNQIQSAFMRWYNAYPKAIADATAIQALPGVHLANLKYGVTNNADVRTYQTALRAFLSVKNRLGNLNPSGVTGNYFGETQAMTKAVYNYEATLTSDLSWLKGDITVPGPKMLNVIGLRAL